MMRTLMMLALAATLSIPGVAQAGGVQAKSKRAQQQTTAKAKVDAKAKAKMKAPSGALRRQVKAAAFKSQPNLQVTRLRFTSNNGTKATAVIERPAGLKQEAKANKIKGRWRVSIGRLQNTTPTPRPVPLH